MRYLRFAAGLALVILIHLAGARLWPDFPRAVNLYLALVVFAALRGHAAEAIAIGTVAGLAHDTLAGSPYGLHGFADTIVGYLAARVAQRLILDRAASVFAVIAVAVLLEQTVLVLLTSLLMTGAGAPAPIWWVLQALVSGAVGALAYRTLGAFRSGRERRHRDRSGKLRLGR